MFSFPGIPARKRCDSPGGAANGENGSPALLRPGRILLSAVRLLAEFPVHGLAGWDDFASTAIGSGKKVLQDIAPGVTKRVTGHASNRKLACFDGNLEGVWDVRQAGGTR